MAVVASSISDAVKRLLVGRPFRSDSYRVQALPKRIAMPVFASDMLSSVAYAPDEILLGLAVAGMAGLHLGPWVGVGVGVVIVLLVVCYRQNLRAYPDGGGDYEVAAKNLGRGPSLFVASALLVDYTLTLAVSMAVFAAYLAAAWPVLAPHTVWIAVAGIALVTLLGLRGWRSRRKLLAAPTYLFIAAVGLTLIVGAIRVLSGDPPSTASSQLHIADPADPGAQLTGIGLLVLFLRSFASGSVALAGVETVATAVPSFRKPRGRNAGNTLLLTGVLSIVLLVGLTWLAGVTGVKYVERPEQALLRADGTPVGDYAQDPVLGQLALGVFDFAPALGYCVIIIAALVLLAAANTSVEGFPGLASRLARDGFLPRQLAQRGDRMTLSNGILLLAGAAVVLVVATGAEPTRLVQMYLVGVFFSFAIGQLGMVRHWTVRVRRMVSSPARTRMLAARLVAGFSLVVVGAVLLIVVVTKFTHGAWLALVAMVVLSLIMGAVRRHYQRVDSELAAAPDDPAQRLPPNTHAVVVVTEIHKPTLRALSFARATRPTFIGAITVAVDEDAAAQLQRRWDEMELPVPLTILASPYRALVRPVLGHIARIRRDNPEDLVIVFIPQFILGRWWEHLLHNQTVLRLKSRLLIVPNVVVATVPWRLQSFTAGPDAYIEPLRPARDQSETTWGDQI